MAARAFYGWRLLAAFWLIAVINLAFPAYGSAVLNAAMAAELGFDRQSLGTMVAVYLAMSGLPGPLVADERQPPGGPLDAGDRQRLPDRRRDDAGDHRQERLARRVRLRSARRHRRCDRRDHRGSGRCRPLVRAAARPRAVDPLFGRRHRRVHRAADPLGDHDHGPRLLALWLVAGGGAVGRRRADRDRNRARAAVRCRPGPGRAGGGRCAALVPGRRRRARAFPAFVTRTDWTYRDALRGPLFLDDAHAVRRGERRLRAVPRSRRRASEGSRPLDSGRRLGDRHDDDQRVDREGDPCCARRPSRSPLPVGAVLRGVRGRADWSSSARARPRRSPCPRSAWASALAVASSR